MSEKRDVKQNIYKTEFVKAKQTTIQTSFVLSTSPHEALDVLANREGPCKIISLSLVATEDFNLAHNVSAHLLIG